MTLATNRRLLRRQSLRRRPFQPIIGRGFTSNLADVVVLVIGLTATSTVHFVGDLPISEVILVSLLPVILAVHGRRVLKPEYKVLFFLLGLWLLGQVVSDIYRHSARLDWMRGDAAIIFFGLDLLGLAVLLRRNERRKVIFLAGSAIGSILVTFIHPSDFAQDQPWKFGYASGVITLVLLISSFFYARRRYLIGILFIMGVAGVNLLENYRSPVGQLLIVVALVFPVIPEQFGRLRILPRSRGAARVAVLLGLSLGSVWVASSLVDYVTSAGLVSEEARAKNEAEKKGGSLLGGRPEIQVSLQAVKDSPIIGHGSWAQDIRYVEMLFDIEVEKGVFSSSDIADFQTSYIPTHSHLMGAWVWAGVFGATFWFYVLWLTARATLRIALIRPPLAPVYTYMLIGLFWNIIFSPFGLSQRAADAFMIVLALDLLEFHASSIKATTAVAVPRLRFPVRRRSALLQ